MTTTVRQEQKFNKVVNFDKDTKEVIVLDYIFKHGDGFKGATGSRFEPVTKNQYMEVINMDTEEIADYLIDAGFELPEHYKRGGFIEWAENFSTDDILNLFFDLSYSNLHDDIREQTGLTEEEAYIFNCTGGGRCFDKNFKGNINKDLSKLIRQAEK